MSLLFLSLTQWYDNVYFGCFCSKSSTSVNVEEVVLSFRLTKSYDFILILEEREHNIFVRFSSIEKVVLEA